MIVKLSVAGTFAHLFIGCDFLKNSLSLIAVLNAGDCI